MPSGTNTSGLRTGFPATWQLLAVNGYAFAFLISSTNAGNTWNKSPTMP